MKDKISPLLVFANDEITYKQISDQVKVSIERAARVLDVKGYARVDAFVRIYDHKQAETIIVEINSLPGMTPATVIFHQAALNGYKPYEFIDQIIDFGFTRQYKSANTTASVENVSSPALAQVVPPIVQSPQEPTALNQTKNDKNMDQLPQLGNSFGERAKYFFSSILGFFRTPIFLRNCLAMLGLMILLFLGLNWWLNWYTHHGKTRSVHEYIGMHIDDARKLARKSTFEIVINDSVFVVGKAPNVILDQNPKPKTEVKRKRRIYVTTTSNTPPLVPLPQLIGNYDYGQYTRKLGAIRYQL